MHKRSTISSARSAALTAALLIACAPAAEAQDGASAQPYRSPYSLNFTAPRESLLAPDSVEPRDNFHKESETPYEEWYSRRVRKLYGAWGPEARHYPPPAGAGGIEWKRERILAVGEKLIGLAYQHHHIPDWLPPPGWPEIKVKTPGPIRGLDCSNFTSWLYNYGLGIKFTSNVHKQANIREGRRGGDVVPVVALDIPDPKNYDEVVSRLATGDLLYIKSKQGEISHVIVWVGALGFSPDGTPLIMDCTGNNHTDSNHTTIPCGVHLRPFSRDSWYFQSFSHAHRIVLD